MAEEIVSKYKKNKYSIYLIRNGQNYRIEIHDDYSFTKKPKARTGWMTKNAAMVELQRLRSEKPKIVL